MGLKSSTGFHAGQAQLSRLESGPWISRDSTTISIFNSPVVIHRPPFSRTERRAQQESFEPWARSAPPRWLLKCRKEQQEPPRRRQQHNPRGGNGNLGTDREGLPQQTPPTPGKSGRARSFPPSHPGDGAAPPALISCPRRHLSPSFLLTRSSSKSAIFYLPPPGAAATIIVHPERAPGT